MTKPINILGFAGSLRRGSCNRGLLRAAAELLPESMNMESFDLAPIPLFNADIQDQGDPAPVIEFKERISAADGVLIACPEYNHSMPGVLKNAIDWASRPADTSPLNGKPLAMVGGGGLFGSVRSQAHLRQVAVSVNMLVMNRPQLMIVKVSQKFDDQSNLVDEETRDKLQTVLKAYALWIDRLR